MLHQTIKDGIKDALRAKDTLRLEVLRGLNALFQNELLASTTTPTTSGSNGNDAWLPDDKVLTLIKRSAKQRRDSISQFEKGNRPDLVEKEKAELIILESFLPTLMSRAEIKIIASQRIEALGGAQAFDLKSAGKVTGILMKELAGKADGADVKAVVEEIVTGK